MSKYISLKTIDEIEKDVLLKERMTGPTADTEFEKQILDFYRLKIREGFSVSEISDRIKVTFEDA